MNIIKYIIVYTTFFSAFPVMACQFDTDCNSPGAVCAVPHGSIYGVCSGGMLPVKDTQWVQPVVVPNAVVPPPRHFKKQSNNLFDEE